MKLEGLPPIHSLEAERSVLGAMLSDPENVIDTAAEKLRAEDFFHPAHQAMFSALLDMRNKGMPIDPSTVLQFLEDRKLADAVGGAPTIGELSAGVISVLTAPTNIETVRAKALLRGLQQTCAQIVYNAQERQHEADTVLDEAEASILGISDRKVSATVMDAAQVVQAAYQEVMDMADGKASQRLKVGWPEWDSKTSGHDPGSMVVIAARPGVGKTALALTLMDNLLKAGEPTGFVSLEMRTQQLTMRLLSKRSNVPLWKIREARMSEHESDTMALEGDKLQKEPWSMVYDPGASISAVRAHIRRMVKRTKIKAVFVDYIGLITAPEKENRLQEVSHVSRQLKQIAGDMGIVIFPLCQLNRNVEDKEPALHHLKESGQIEQDADAVALIHRAWIKEGEMSLEGWIKLAKVREGQTGRIDVLYDGPHTSFMPKGR